MVADTILSAHGNALPIEQGVLKHCVLPGDLCVSYSNSPELAKRDFDEFISRFAPKGAAFSDAVNFFLLASERSGNDYLLAFGRIAKLVAIRGGVRQPSVSNTQWVGNRDAYKRFCQLEKDQRLLPNHQRAVTVVYMADEQEDSPASDLYNAMRNLIQERSFYDVGGFAAVISFREIGFRYAVLSDTLFDWPFLPGHDAPFSMNLKAHLVSTGENDRYSLSQVSPSYYNMNMVAFYVLKGSLLFVFKGEDNRFADECAVLKNVRPTEIGDRLNAFLNFNIQPLLTVMSSSSGERPYDACEKDGVSLSMFCEANTFPKTPVEGVPVLTWA